MEGEFVDEESVVVGIGEGEEVVVVGSSACWRRSTLSAPLPRFLAILFANEKRSMNWYFNPI